MTFSKDSVSRKEIYRYLGYKGFLPDDTVQQMTECVLEELFKVIQPKHVYQSYVCQIQKDLILLGNYSISSSSLSRNLAQCSHVILFAATLGIQCDKLIQRYTITNMAKASIAQACGAAAIEAYCNHIQEEIRLQALEHNLYLSPRFSPGYGDLPLETQQILFDSLQCTKRLGLTLTDSLLMYPSKSVTAFIGLTKNKQSCHISKCGTCKNIGCEFRYED